MRTLRSAILLLALAATAGGCAPTQFRDTWRNPEARGLSLASKTVVVSVQHADEASRRSAEDALVAKLVSRGARGIASYTLGGVEMRDTSVAKEAVRRAGANALLVMRLTGTRERVTSTMGAGMMGDPFFARPWGFWGAGWGMAYAPMVQSEQIVTVETRLYQVADQSRLLWAGLSETTEPRRLDRMLLDVARRAVDEMRKEGLLAAGN